MYALQFDPQEGRLAHEAEHPAHPQIPGRTQTQEKQKVTL